VGHFHYNVRECEKYLWQPHHSQVIVYNIDESVQT
jgi:hypothetical protein